MNRKDRILVLTLAILFFSSLTTFQSVNSETAVETDNQYTISDANAIIMLSENASTTNATYFPAHFSSVDGLYIPPFWMFTNFSTGNGTINLAVSANNCNITITSFSSLTRNDSEQYAIYTDSWLNYTVDGRGNQTVAYTYLYSSYLPTNNTIENLDVYIDGVAKQQGDGWSGAHIGITITGATSRVSIHQASMARNAPHYEPIDYLLPISITVASVVIVSLSLLIFRKHRKTSNLGK
jgi:hypothetical protein